MGFHTSLLINYCKKPTGAIRMIFSRYILKAVAKSHGLISKSKCVWAPVYSLSLPQRAVWHPNYFKTFLKISTRNALSTSSLTTNLTYCLPFAILRLNL
jgi:hypothetical protein